MGKLKTHKGAKKRFKFTATGKVKFKHENKSHILTKKSSKRKRRLKKSEVLPKHLEKKMKKLMPND